MATWVIIEDISFRFVKDDYHYSRGEALTNIGLSVNCDLVEVFFA